MAEIIRKKIPPLRLSKVGEPCAYCGRPAETFDHVIPKRVAPFFDAGWNLTPACSSCNQRKRDHVKIDLVKTPGNDPYEDAAIWAVVYSLLDASWDQKRHLMERAQADLAKWDVFTRSMAFGALEVYIGEHWCCLWAECQERCSTGGQLVDLKGHSEVHIAVPHGLERLISGDAYA